MIHRGAHERFDAGDPEVVATMAEIAALAERALTPLTLRDSAGLGVLLDATSSCASGSTTSTPATSS